MCIKFKYVNVEFNVSKWNGFWFHHEALHHLVPKGQNQVHGKDIA